MTDMQYIELSTTLEPEFAEMVVESDRNGNGSPGEPAFFAEDNTLRLVMQVENDDVFEAANEAVALQFEILEALGVNPWYMFDPYAWKISTQRLLLANLQGENVHPSEDDEDGGDDGTLVSAGTGGEE